MKKILSVVQTKNAEKSLMEKGVSESQMMEKAALGVFNSFDWKNKKTLIVCGSGNNGGDGYALAEMLFDNAFDCEILRTDKLTETSGIYYKNCLDKNIKISRIDEFTADSFDFSCFDVIVDCLFGTGFHGDMRFPFVDIIKKINNSPAYIVSVDISSGTNGDNGCGKNSVISDLTVAIGSYKTGHFLGDAKDNNSEIIVTDIGFENIKADTFLVEDIDFKNVLKRRKNNSNKGDYGYVGIFGGCLEYCGAVKLAGRASMRSGAGVCRLIIPSEILLPITSDVSVNTVFPIDLSSIDLENQLESALDKLKAVAFGVGTKENEKNVKVLDYILKTAKTPLIIDAGGLNILSKNLDLLNEKTASVLITPHLKEFERLSGIPLKEIVNNPIKYASKFALKYNVIVLLKGASTIITDGRKNMIVDRGCSGMASAGSGDVLTGVITALCGSGAPLFDCAVCGAYICGAAGELAQKQFGAVSMTAEDTMNNLSSVINRIYNSYYSRARN